MQADSGKSSRKLMRRRRIVDRLAHPRDESGFGMITVLGYSIVITIFLGVAVTLVLSVLKSGNGHVKYGQTFDAAEAGLDQSLSRLQKDQNWNTGVADTVPATWVYGFPDQETEKHWALDRVNADLAAGGQVTQTPEGQFFVVKPPNTHTVYSMGWVPDRAHAQRTRLVKSEYLFSTYNPTNAIITSGNIDISGSFTLSQVPGTTGLPNVHTEGTVGCNASLNVPPGTRVGSVLANSCGGVRDPSQIVPTVDPRFIYTSQSDNYAHDWYDLCPDGAAYKPSTAGPCSAIGLSGGSPAVPGQLAVPWVEVRLRGQRVVYFEQRLPGHLLRISRECVPGREEERRRQHDRDH